MIKIKIADVIGFFGITDAMISEQLNEAAAGEEAVIEINSPGGSCFMCIAIFNTIREFAKSHPVSVIINGIAASAAGVIAIAARTVNPQAKVEVSENSIFFIHNPYGFGEGDYRTMQKNADYLQRMAAMFANIYSGVSGQGVKKTRAAMDFETYYIGKEIQDAGFANSLQIINQNSEDTSEARAALIAGAEMSIAAAKKKIEESETPDDFEKAAALLQETFYKGGVAGAGPGLDSSTPETTGARPEPANKQTPEEGKPSAGKEGKMNPEYLLAQHPECYKAVFALGQNAERERVTAHLKLAEKGHCYETAAKYIQDGASVMTESVQAEYLTLLANAQHNAARLGDNPGDVHTGDDTVDDAKALAAFDKGYLNREEK
ncbi:MAG: Clp protease ClpP [Treponema sp.]|jgi:ATP-dependent protease ClpP protease subunit|nr:Clp protease ClpP [Treponema sp.]